MISMLVAHRQRARFLGHDLWVAQRTDGSWQVWIEGEKTTEHKPFLATQEEARRAAHFLAHIYIEGKHLCDCTNELDWQHGQRDVAAENRIVKRINYICEIRCEEQGVFRIGRIGNLSTEGAFIQTPDPSLMGSVLNLSFSVGSVQVETQGQVVHRNPQEGMGVRFLNLDPSSRAAIADVLLRQSD